MPLSMDEVSKVLPLDVPKSFLPEYFADLQTNLPKAEVRVLGWIVVLASKVDGLAPWRTVAGYRFTTYGLVDDVTFGVTVYAAPESRFSEHERIGDVSAGGPVRDECEPIEIEGRTFPVVVRRPFEILHGTPQIHPRAGRSACWASSAKHTGQAILTAAHVLKALLGRDPAIGDIVPMDHLGTPVSGTVVDVAPGGIDAALVQPPNTAGVGAPGTALPTTLPLPWMDVTIHAPAGPIATKVTSVTDTRGIINSPLLPARVITAKAGRAGDSGSLALDASHQGIGLYIGELADPARRVEGICQHLAQAVRVLGLSLFD